MSLYSFVGKPEYVKESGLCLLAQRVLACKQTEVSEVKVGE